MNSDNFNEGNKAITGEFKSGLNVFIKLPSHSLVDKLVCLGFVIDDFSI